MPDLLSSIDVHCHIFNGRDLPVEGFLSKVVLVDYPPPIADALEPLIFLLATIMHRAPTVEEELKVLDGIARRRATRGQYAQSRDQRRAIVLFALRKFLARGKAARQRRGSLGSIIPFKDCFDLVDLLYFRATRGGRFPKKFTRRDLQKLADLLIVGGEDMLQFVPWALIFSNYRFIILDELAHLA